MKIFLLNPPFKIEYGRYSRASRSPAITKSGTIYYPFWLAYAAGVLEKRGHEVKLVDSCAYSYDRNKVFQIAKDFNPDLIALDTSTPSIYNDVEIGAELKRILPKSFLILTGAHPSALPQETLNLNTAIDAVACKEYDYTLLDLADTIESRKDIGRVKGIAYRNGKRVIHNPPRDLIENLDELPFVSSVYKKHLDPGKYFFAAGRYPMMMIMTGRGCSFGCFFCVYPQVFHGNKYRLRSAENVADEFEYIAENFPQVKEIGIEDDTFTANINRLEDICSLLIKRKINKKLKWWSNVRVNLDLDTMGLMKEAGCRLVIPGFESGNQGVLNNIKKGITVEESLEFAKNAKRAKLLVHGCFMVGNPGDTKETMQQTLRFAIKLNTDTAQFFPMIPYPGTKAHAWARENSFLKDTGFDRWLTQGGGHKTVIERTDLTAKELTEFCSYARKKYYIRLGYIWNKIGQCLLNPGEAKRTWKSLRLFFKHLIT